MRLLIKGYKEGIHDIDDVDELVKVSGIRKQMKVFNVSEREKILHRFEMGEFVKDL